MLQAKPLNSCSPWVLFLFYYSLMHPSTALCTRYGQLNTKTRQVPSYTKGSLKLFITRCASFYDAHFLFRFEVKVTHSRIDSCLSMFLNSISFFQINLLFTVCFYILPYWYAVFTIFVRIKRCVCCFCSYCYLIEFSHCVNL